MEFSQTKNIEGQRTGRLRPRLLLAELSSTTSDLQTDFATATRDERDTRQIQATDLSNHWTGGGRRSSRRR